MASPERSRVASDRRCYRGHVARLAIDRTADRSGSLAPVEESGAAVPTATLAPLRARWLGRVAYRDAWELQHRVVRARAAGLIGDQLILLEHDPVLTLGRHADPSHVRVSAAVLRRQGVEVIQVERGGEVTYHGPGQLVAYPILRLADRGLLLRPFVRALEAEMIDACAAGGVAAGRRDGLPGCWCVLDTEAPRKIGALGVRVERGVTYHGIALNVDTDLRMFDLIDACGMPNVVSTSIADEVGRTAEAPSTAAVGRAAAAFADSFARAVGASLEGALPPEADSTSERAQLEAEVAVALAALPDPAALDPALADPASAPDTAPGPPLEAAR
jgi:lipoyl(octanoyl) transferase